LRVKKKIDCDEKEKEKDKLRTKLWNEIKISKNKK
jgi:hypothetical protein